MSRRTKHTGFTLLEVVLALALTVVVMTAIGIAIFLHLRAVDRTRLAIERDQIARILLRRIGDDLRSAVRLEPPDDAGMQALQTLMQSAKNAGQNSGSGGGGGGSAGSQSSRGAQSNTGTAGTANTTGTTSTARSTGTAQQISGGDDSSQTQPADETTAGTPAAIAGLYGTAYDLQVDLARVPRPDEFTSAMLAGTSPPSDVRTVYYFLANAATGLSATGESGLMRSEMNRAAALYASGNGDFEIFLRNGQLLAPEVAAVEFRYFDGLEWFTEWNSQSMSGLPMAVEVAIMLYDPRLTAEQTVTAGSLFDPASGLDQELVYRTMIRLPSAQLASATSASGASTSSSSGTGSGGSSSSGTSSGTSGTGGMQ
jgi:type II secretory pathway pseudopilin PulG